MMPLLELRGVRRSYQSGDEIVEVLKGIDLTIYRGEMVAIMGASGSGKSTLMNILGCLDKATSGHYLISGHDVEDLDKDELATLRREHFGFIFQRYHLLPHLTATNNVEIPAVYAGHPVSQRRERAKVLLSQLGLAERVDYYPSQLSGGQQQRVSIARALMNGGQVILADEPTGALDSHSSEEVMNILKGLKQQGHTIVIVTHDPAVAAQAERIVEIHDGDIIADNRSTSDDAAVEVNLADKGLEVQSSWHQTFGRFSEALSMAWKSMVANKMRTILTMLGIIIGIASVVSIVVIGDAAKQMILHDIKSIGTNTIDVYPGKNFGDYDPANMQALSAQDLSALKQQPYVDSVSPELSRSMNLLLGSTTVSANVSGVSEQYFRANGLTLRQGILINQEQLASSAQVVVIDELTRERLFPNQADVVGENIIVGNMPATIIGVVKPRSRMFGGGGMLRVWIPYSTMQTRIIGQNWFDSITVRIKDGYNTKQVEQALTRYLTLLHGKKDFFTYNLDTIVQTAERTTQNLQLFLMFVAVISLVVGGIGVMNIMLVSVTERTREIGIRMAIGARSTDVLQQFLIEAILVCLVGGLIGLLIAFGIGSVVGLFIPSWHIQFQPLALISAFICSTAIGVIFGFLPARRAAKLNPIDALARE